MAATRGARYLLRNGLDYINYQEYERALKYLREAETRQKELSKAERLTLKQAIERAQRGLREAVGSDTPYALSQRSRRPGGFAVAKPDTQIAARPFVAPAQEMDTQIAARPSVAPAKDREPVAHVQNREGDDQGQPIQLTGTEVTNPVPSAPAVMATPAPVSADIPQPLPITADQPAQPSSLSKFQGGTPLPETVAEKLIKSADVPSEPVFGAIALASVPAAMPSPTAPTATTVLVPTQGTQAPADTNVPAPSPAGPHRSRVLPQPPSSIRPRLQLLSRLPPILCRLLRSPHNQCLHQRLSQPPHRSLWNSSPTPVPSLPSFRKKT